MAGARVEKQGGGQNAEGYLHVKYSYLRRRTSERTSVGRQPTQQGGWEYGGHYPQGLTPERGGGDTITLPATMGNL